MGASGPVSADAPSAVASALAVVSAAATSVEMYPATSAAASSPAMADAAAALTLAEASSNALTNFGVRFAIAPDASNESEPPPSVEAVKP